MDVEFVAVNNTVVAGNYAHDSYAFDEVKGGSQNSLIFANTIINPKSTGILVGGHNSTYEGVFVHPDANYEALNDKATSFL